MFYLREKYDGQEICLLPRIRIDVIFRKIHASYTGLQFVALTLIINKFLLLIVSFLYTLQNDKVDIVDRNFVYKTYIL